MTRREAMRQTHQENTLIELGFTLTEAAALRRISLTLHRWAEHECNGAIQRDGDHGDGRPFWYNTNTGKKVGPVADRERGAVARLNGIISARNQRVIGALPEPATIDGCAAQAIDRSVSYYLQGDPRGAALYILRPGDVPEGKDAGSYYDRGIVIY